MGYQSAAAVAMAVAVAVAVAVATQDMAVFTHNPYTPLPIAFPHHDRFLSPFRLTLSTLPQNVIEEPCTVFISIRKKAHTHIQVGISDPPISLHSTLLHSIPNDLLSTGPYN